MSNETVLLKQARNLINNRIKTLQDKLHLIDLLISGEPVLEPSAPPSSPGGSVAEPPGTPIAGIQKRPRTASSNSIYARVRQVVVDSPDKEFTTKDLAAALRKRWKKDYGKKGNLIAVISALLTCKENRNANWCTKRKLNGKWYFRASADASIQKSA